MFNLYALTKVAGYLHTSKKFGRTYMPLRELFRGTWVKKKFARGHTGVTELFRGMEVTINFHKGIQVKDSIQSSLIVYGSDMVFKALLRR